MEPIQHSRHVSRKKNSARINLTISVIIHGLLFAMGAYWAAHADLWDVLDLHSLDPDAAAQAAHAAEAQGWAVWQGVEETTMGANN